MTKRQYFYLSFTLLFLALAIGYDYINENTTKVDKYQSAIQQHLHSEENKVLEFFEDKAFIHHITQALSFSLEEEESDFEHLRELAKERFTISIFKGDSLIFWNNNYAKLPVEETLIKSPERTTKFLRLTNGYYELMSQTFRDKAMGQYSIYALIPIKNEYELTSNYLSNNFLADASIPHNIKLIHSTSEYPILTVSGDPLCYLLIDETLVDKNTQQTLLWFYALAFLFLALLLHDLAMRIAKSQRPWLGAAFLILAVFGIRILSILFNFSEQFNALPLFAENFHSPWSKTLGDLLLNILLLLWMMIFFHREYPIRTFNHLNSKVRFGLTILNYLSIILGILLLTGVFKTLVFNSGITFNFDNVFDLNRYSLISIIGVILLLISLFIFSHRMMLAISQMGFSKYVRLWALAIASVVTFPVLWFSDFLLPWFFLSVLAALLILIFDLFIDSNKTNFTWLVIWLVILAAFPSFLLFIYNAYKDRVVRLSYAKELAELRDPIAEFSFSELKDLLSKDPHLKKHLVKPYPFKTDQQALKKHIDSYFSRDNYLFYNYQYQVTAFNKYKTPALEEQEEGFDIFENKLRNSFPTEHYNLRFWQDYEDKSWAYLMQIDVPVLDNPDNEFSIVLEFERNRRVQSKVYTELLVDKPYKQLSDLGNYEYAVYKNRERFDSEGKIYGPSLTIDQLPEIGKSKEMSFGNRSEVIFTANKDTVVIIGRDKETFIKAISLFSYIFGMLVCFILVFSLINTFFQIIPGTLDFSHFQKPSLKNRIQLAVIALTFVSFVSIGLVTVWFFKTSSEDYHEKRLARKTQSVLTDAQHEIELLHSFQDSAFNLKSILKPISKIHRIDINLFDLNGQLIASSEEDFFNKGIVDRKMGAVAFQALSKKGLSEFIQDDEHMGALSYKSAYVPLKKADQVIAYMGLPYYSKQSQLRSDVTVFMSTLLNVYVFLLLIAGGIAIATADSITRPLAKIGEKLKDLKLGKRNEPLDWKSNDELGALINEYNKMITKLEDSADKLAQSEREDAWREMAKQVAHEIKNPLTPMKLSIQYLQHAYQSQPDNIEPLLKRVSATLIEQIDNLAQIASEFSNFAKMPRAENQKTLLNGLIGSVFDLFSNEDADLSLEMPNEQFFVYADKNHLVRVFNNLIKNAIQAIPDDRRGKVDVFLYKENGKAIVRVKDNGTGITEDKREKVFVPNFTTKNSGTGLGLAISKNIIESINGKIWFDTVVGVGTDFYVELPLVEVLEFEEA